MRNGATLLGSWFKNFKKISSLWPHIQGMSFLLVGAGLIMVYSASFISSQERFGDGFYFLKRQLVFSVLGAGSFWWGTKLSSETLQKAARPLFWFSLLLLALTLVPGLGFKAGGASRWLKIGPIRFQPSEFFKMAFLLFLAQKVQQKEFSEISFKEQFLVYLLPLLPALGILYLQPDFGTSVLVMATFYGVLFGLGKPLKYLLGTLFFTLPLGAVVILTSAYRRARVESFLDPWKDAGGKGFQVIQSLVGVFSGKLFGVGLGNSKEKLLFLPEAHNDFIFAVIGEELGLVGMGVFIYLYIRIIHQGLDTSLGLRSLFQQALALGISMMLAFQVFINMGVVVGLLPAKGMPLPLISYGGTSLILTLFLLGILSRLQKEATHP